MPEPTTFVLGGDLPVRRLGYGAMRLTPWSGPPAHVGAAVALLRHAVDAGVQLVDTADFYGLGANEELISQALHPYPDDLVIATKVGSVRASPTEWIPLGRPEYLRQQAELSLRRLRVDRLDLLQLHRVDPQVPLADQLGALTQLQTEGKVRHIGLSDVTLAQLDQARCLVDVAAVQNAYSVVERTSEAVLARCEEHQIAVLPYHPIAACLDGTPALEETAIALEATPAQVALAWLLHRAPVLMPIPGTTRSRHLQENLAASSLVLSQEQLARLTAAAA